MTAADQREALEAVIHAQLTRAWKYGLEPGSGRGRPAELILAAADEHAEAVADERIAGRVASRSAGRERLEQAAAEIAGRAS